MDAQERAKRWNQIVAKSWSDPAFKKELISHPEKILKEYGIDTKGKKPIIHEDKKNEFHLVIPLQPNLNEHDLRFKSAGGDDDGEGCI